MVTMLSFFNSLESLGGSLNNRDFKDGKIDDDSEGNPTIIF